MPPVPSARLISNPEAAHSMAAHVDDLIAFAQVDSELHMACVKYQMEHAAAKASFDAEDTDEVEQMQHLGATLCRTLDLATTAVTVILQRATASGTTRSPVDSAPRDPPSQAASLGPSDGSAGSYPGTAGGAGMPEAGSFDDLASGEGLLERDATLMQRCTRVCALAFIVSETVRAQVQRHSLDNGLLRAVRTALCLPRQCELRSFAEGFKTEHMNVLSNMTYGCVEVCDAVAADEELMRAILGATRIDEENPGLVEWAEFTVRNVCAMAPVAAEFIQGHMPLTKPHTMTAAVSRDAAPASTAAVGASSA